MGRYEKIMIWKKCLSKQQLVAYRVKAKISFTGDFCLMNSSSGIAVKQIATNTI